MLYEITDHNINFVDIRSKRLTFLIAIFLIIIGLIWLAASIYVSRSESWAPETLIIVIVFDTCILLVGIFYLILGIKTDPKIYEVYPSRIIIKGKETQNVIEEIATSNFDEILKTMIYGREKPRLKHSLLRITYTFVSASKSIKLTIWKNRGAAEKFDEFITNNMKIPLRIVDKK